MQSEDDPQNTTDTQNYTLKWNPSGRRSFSCSTSEGLKGTRPQSRGQVQTQHTEGRSKALQRAAAAPRVEVNTRCLSASREREVSAGGHWCFCRDTSFTANLQEVDPILVNVMLSFNLHKVTDAQNHERGNNSD